MGGGGSQCTGFGGRESVKNRRENFGGKLIRQNVLDLILSVLKLQKVLSLNFFALLIRCFKRFCTDLIVIALSSFLKGKSTSSTKHGAAVRVKRVSPCSLLHSHVLPVEDKYCLRHHYVLECKMAFFVCLFVF